MVFDPPTRWTVRTPLTTTVYFGTDGGFARTDDGTLSFVSLNEGLANTLFYDIDIGRGPLGSAVTFGGMHRTRTGGHSAIDAELSWNFPAGGDGDRTAIDGSNPHSVFGFQNNHLTWTPNSGEFWFVEGDDILPAQPVITEVHNTKPIEVVTTGHPFRDKDTVTITGVVRGASMGAAVIANGAAKIHRVDDFVFELTGKDGSGTPPFTPVPAVTGLRCLQSRRITDVTATTVIEIRNLDASRLIRQSAGSRRGCTGGYGRKQHSRTTVLASEENHCNPLFDHRSEWRRLGGLRARVGTRTRACRRRSGPYPSRTWFPLFQPPLRRRRGQL